MRPWSVTSGLLRRGTTKRSAEQFAEELDFLAARSAPGRRSRRRRRRTRIGDRDFVEF